MTLINEIRENLASKYEGAMELTSIDSKFPAWTIRNGDEFGVAVPYDSDDLIAETFTSCGIHSRKMSIGGTEYRMFLVLTCMDETLRYQFSVVCAEFVDPGNNGEKRKGLTEKPLEWWENWCELLGNTVSDGKPYSVIGEMLVLDELVKEKKPVLWAAVNNGSHDIESDDTGYEVKSTVKKYDSTVTVSSHFQLLDDNKKLYLYFCRFEKSVHGISIDDLVEKLVSHGYDRNRIERELEHQGLEKGSHLRSERYKCLERRKYSVDEKFPKITDSSFKSNKLPDHIVKIEYTIDLSGLNYEEW